MQRGLVVAKIAAIAGFLVLLASTYYLRTRVLTLNRIRFSASSVLADEEKRKQEEMHPMRVRQYEAQLEAYKVQVEDYNEMIKLYRTDYENYVRRLQDKYVPPEPPIPPQQPRSPQLSRKLMQINTEFRNYQYQYFIDTSRANTVAGLAALILTGSLLVLLMFDTNGQRLFYLTILILSFVFLIGPAFHSILSAVVGFLHPPMYY